MAGAPTLTRLHIERVRVEGHISTPECRAALNALVEHAWPTVFGTRRRVDITGIDAGAWTDDVHDWAKQFPKSRVIMLRGVAGDNQPALALVRKERRRDGKLVKYQGRFFNVGTNGLKGGLYKFLRVSEPEMRGYVDFPAGLEDDFFEQLTAEKRTPKIDRKGFTVYEWTKPRNASKRAIGSRGLWRSPGDARRLAHPDPGAMGGLAAEREAMGAHPDQNTEAAGQHPTQLGLWSAPLSAGPRGWPSLLHRRHRLMAFCRIPPELIGIDDATLQKWLTDLQQSLQDLTVGGKAQTLSYAQGDGSKSVTYTQADQARIEQRIRMIAAALGLVPPRRAIAVRF
jgi:hypothetical protein